MVAKSGDPFALARTAAESLEQGSPKPKSANAHRFLIFDSDLLGQNPNRDAELRFVADRAGLVLIRQNGRSVSILLQRLIVASMPPPSLQRRCVEAIKTGLVEVLKGCTALDLSRRFQLAGVQKAAADQLNSDCAKLLESLGMLRVPMGTGT